MKLRARFTLALALVALLPIAVAAFVTREMIARSYRKEFRDNQMAARQTLQREVARLQDGVAEAVKALTGRDHPLTGGILRELVKGGGDLDGDAMRRLREQGGPVMRGLALDLLAVTGPSDAVLLAPHMRAAVGELDSHIADQAQRTKGAVTFAMEKLISAAGTEQVFMAQAAQRAEDGKAAITVMVGRRVSADLLSAARRPNRIDARIRIGDTVVVAALGNWTQYATSNVETIALPSSDGRNPGVIEIYVSDGDSLQVLRNVTLVSALLAIVALLLVVLIGTFVARRVTRDLDVLVKGSMAAARGDLEYRVPVRAQDEVGAVAHSFNFMMEDLKVSKERLVIAERIAAWQEIARRLAHEIKNPLTPIQMAMDTLRKTWRTKHPSFDEILEESTTTVLQEADRLKRIVSEFSDFARMPKPEFGPVSLNEVIENGLALYQGTDAVDVQLGDLPKIEADRGQLQQVLLNLVENARDAVAQRVAKGGGPGKILVSTALRKDRIEWVVQDNGIGVPADVREKVFAPYFSTKLSQGGTGLGLAIVHRIISDHGGRISLSDVAGGGARFSIELPMRASDALLTSRM
ncbi:MAG: HAMP domain-containing protein [Kofleriaceae bacterium]|nr:HAMP domain-containing protein [Kofleriaceae bacterium]